MPTSYVSIANLALQKLGAASIVALDASPGSPAEMNACYEALRDTELRKNRWKFAIARATLAPDATAPDFGYTYAFPVPANFLALIKPARLGLDWHLESHQGQLCILTNDSATLEIRYIWRVTDPTRFDPCFVEMYACRLAWHTCERITQSNTKKAALMEEYDYHRRDARKANAFELPITPQPVDEWIVGRSTGQLVNSEWAEE